MARKFKTPPKSYNGWRNYETWNVSMFLGTNHEHDIREFMQTYKGRKPYKDFRELYLVEANATYDKVSYWDPKLATGELNRIFWE